MSVVIKGMEMPPNCSECGCEQEGFWCGVLEGYSDTKCFDSKRRPDCPLVSVPPHGRLIDADALAETHRAMAYENGGRNYPFHTLAKSWVEDAPTIIEGDE